MKVSKTSTRISGRKFSSNWIMTDGRIFIVVCFRFRFGHQKHRTTLRGAQPLLAFPTIFQRSKTVNYRWKSEIRLVENKSLGWIEARRRAETVINNCDAPIRKLPRLLHQKLGRAHFRMPKSRNTTDVRNPAMGHRSNRNSSGSNGDWSNLSEKASG